MIELILTFLSISKIGENTKAGDKRIKLKICIKINNFLFTDYGLKNIRFLNKFSFYYTF